MCAYFGGIAAQEVLKACGKFRPLDQWLHFDALEMLPDTPVTPPVTDPAGVVPETRYHHLLSVYGSAVLASLASLRTFVVGSGAIGCELLKNFAMLGVATAADGMITVTDNDRIAV